MKSLSPLIVKSTFAALFSLGMTWLYWKESGPYFCWKKVSISRFRLVVKSSSPIQVSLSGSEDQDIARAYPELRSFNLHQYQEQNRVAITYHTRWRETILPKNLACAVPAERSMETVKVAFSPRFSWER